MPVTETTIEANGMTFRARTAGESGEPVILLHGFPETSHMYIPLMERLAAEGYRCLAPDQRGYSPGARPEGVENYRYLKLAEDIRGFADAMGAERFHLVGHDWGAGAGWALCLRDAGAGDQLDGAVGAARGGVRGSDPGGCGPGAKEPIHPAVRAGRRGRGGDDGERLGRAQGESGARAARKRRLSTFRCSRSPER